MLKPLLLILLLFVSCSGVGDRQSGPMSEVKLRYSGGMNPIHYTLIIKSTGCAFFAGRTALLNGRRVAFVDFKSLQDTLGEIPLPHHSNAAGGATRRPIDAAAIFLDIYTQGSSNPVQLAYDGTSSAGHTLEAMSDVLSGIAFRADWLKVGEKMPYDCAWPVGEL
jgi:hypothetical protein